MSNPFQSTINLGGTSHDVHYRYKMPTLTTHIEKKNGVTTIIDNITTITDVIKRTPKDVSSYFSKNLGANINYVKNKGIVIVGCDKSKDELQEILNSYLEEFVLCDKCKKPETEIKVHKKSKLKICKACSHASTIKT